MITFSWIKAVVPSELTNCELLCPAVPTVRPNKVVVGITEVELVVVLVVVVLVVDVVVDVAEEVVVVDVVVVVEDVVISEVLV